MSSRAVDHKSPWCPKYYMRTNPCSDLYVFEQSLYKKKLPKTRHNYLPLTVITRNSITLNPIIGKYPWN